jgi:thiamine biosynthesis lipoprotein
MSFNDLLTKKTYTAMGGEFQFLTFPQTYLSKEDVLNIFDEAYIEVKRIENKLTDFKSSPFNRINEMAGIQPVVVDQEILSLIKKALEISQKSQGLFDISFASIGHIWRKYSEVGKSIPEEVIANKISLINYHDIVINDVESTVYLPNADMRIGLGGIGKGYAVDAVYNLFLKHGLTNFYVNGAGDLRVHSRADAPRPWRIGIRNPLSIDKVRNVGIIQLANGAIASSGGYINNVAGNTQDHHIIHPKMGRSKTEVIGSTVLADDSTTADTTATILMNMSVTEALKYLNDENLSGIVFSHEGMSYLSDRALKNFGQTLQTR